MPKDYSHLLSGPRDIIPFPNLKTSQICSQRIREPYIISITTPIETKLIISNKKESQTRRLAINSLNMERDLELEKKLNDKYGDRPITPNDLISEAIEDSINSINYQGF